MGALGLHRPERPRRSVADQCARCALLPRALCPARLAQDARRDDRQSYLLSLTGLRTASQSRSLPSQLRWPIMTACCVPSPPPCPASPPSPSRPAPPPSRRSTSPAFTTLPSPARRRGRPSALTRVPPPPRHTR